MSFCIELSPTPRWLLTEANKIDMLDGLCPKLNLSEQNCERELAKKQGLCLNRVSAYSEVSILRLANVIALKQTTVPIHRKLWSSISIASRLCVLAYPRMLCISSTKLY